MAMVTSLSALILEVKLSFYFTFSGLLWMSPSFLGAMWAIVPDLEVQLYS
jgi:hypothetical protein